MRKRNAIGGVIIAFFLLALAAGFTYDYLDSLPKGEGKIFVKTEGNVNAGMLADVQKTADAFNDLLAEKMQATVSGDVQLFVTSEPEAYQAVLKREFQMKDHEAERVAKISGGWTSGRIRVTVLNGSAGVMDGQNDQVSTTGHELFHQVQYALSKGKDTDENALFWLEEGSADYVGAVVAESMGKQRLEKWERDRIHEMHSLQDVVRPEDLQHCTLEQRKVLMEQKKHAYQMSDLMVIYLLQQQPENERMPKLAEYFRALGSSGDGEKAFEKTFQMPVKYFLQGFDQWLQQMMHASADLRIVQREGVVPGVRENIESDMARTQEFLQTVWGSGLHGEYCFVLAANPQDFAAAMRSELAMSEPETRTTAEQSLWIENGSSIILNAGKLDERQQQIFSVAAMTARVLQGQVAASSLDQMEWLSRGSAYLVATHMLGKAQLGTMAQYKAAWLRKVHGASQGVPGLLELKTMKDWQKAQEKYGQDEPTNIAELASLYLLEKHGWKSFYEWYVLTGKTGDAEKSFIKIYGKSSKAFAREFEASLVEKLY